MGETPRLFMTTRMAITLVDQIPGLYLPRLCMRTQMAITMAYQMPCLSLMILHVASLSAYPYQASPAAHNRAQRTSFALILCAWLPYSRQFPPLPHHHVLHGWHRFDGHYNSYLCCQCTWNLSSHHPSASTLCLHLTAVALVLHPGWVSRT